MYFLDLSVAAVNQMPSALTGDVFSDLAMGIPIDPAAQGVSDHCDSNPRGILLSHLNVFKHVSDCNVFSRFVGCCC